MTAADLPDMAVGDMHYRPPVDRVGGTRLRSDAEPCPLKTFLRELPDATKVKDDAPTKRIKKKDEHLDAVILQFPWLQYLDNDQGLSGGSTKKGRHVWSTEDEPVDLTEEDLATMAVKAMEAARAAMPTDAVPEQRDFVIKVRGDTAGQAAKGKAADAVQGVARNARADEFCVRRAMQKTFRAGLHLGPADCGILVRGWCHTLHFFFHVEAASAEGASLYYREADVSGYDEPAEFRMLAERTAFGTEVMHRVNFVRKMRPQNAASGYA